MTDRTFIEEEDTVIEGVPLPVKRRDPSSPYESGDLRREMERQAQYADLLPYGTTVGHNWSHDWITRVSKVEKDKGYAICGAKLRSTELATLVRTGKIEQEQADTDPTTHVCTFKAGLDTAHPGEGRCFRHGGNQSPTAKFSLLRHSNLSPRVREFFESEDLMDLRSAISVIWASVDDVLGDGTDEDEDPKMTMDRAKEVGSLMSRVGNLVKQHNEIMEKRKITIDVPEFIAWAEHFYELAIRYIMEGEKDIQGFLQEAQSYYNATVTLSLGLTPTGDSSGKVHPFSPGEAQ